MRPWIVYSHQRSGSHYICRVIQKNFCVTDNYLDHYGDHTFGGELFEKIKRNQDTVFFYTWRAMDPCLRSIFKLRDRFGLKVDTYEEFLRRPYSTMWRRKKPKKPLFVNTVKEQRYDDTISYFFASVPVTPPDWWELSKSWWKKVQRIFPNVMMINYDNFREDFKYTMHTIADILEVPRKVGYFNEHKRVGWMLSEEKEEEL